MEKKKSSNCVMVLFVVIIILSVLVILTGTGIVSFKDKSSDNVHVSENNHDDNLLNDARKMADYEEIAVFNICGIEYGYYNKVSAKNYSSSP